MSTNYHTALSDGDLADAAHFNAPLGTLDAQITTNTNSINAILGVGGNVASLTNGAASAGQKVVTLDSTTGFIANARVAYSLVGGTLEYNTIDTIGGATQLTLDTNIGTGGIADDAYFSMIGESEYQAAQAINHGNGVSPTIVDAVGWAQGNRHFGAGYNITVDNSAAGNATALTAAIAAVNTAGGGVVELGPGTHSMNGLTLVSLSNVVLVGAGRDATIIKLAAGQNKHLLHLSPASGLRVENLTLDVDKRNQSAGAYDALRIVSSNNVSLRNVTLKNACDVGLRLMGCTNVRLDNVQTYHCGLSGSYTFAGIYILDSVGNGSGTASHDVQIINCADDGSGQDASVVITLQGSPTGGTFTVSHADNTTAAIAYDASAATVQSTLEDLDSIASGDIAVTGSDGGPWTVVFYTRPVFLQVVTNSLTGGTSPAISIATTAEGASIFTSSKAYRIQVDNYRALNGTKYGLKLQGYDQLLSNILVRHAAQYGISIQFGRTSLTGFFIDGSVVGLDMSTPSATYNPLYAAERISNGQISNTEYVGIDLENTADPTHPIYGYEFSNIQVRTITRNYGASYGMYIRGSISDAHLQNCAFIDCKTYGIYANISTTYEPNYLTILGCHALGKLVTPTAGFYVPYGTNSRIQSCRSIGNTTAYTAGVGWTNTDND